jgi:hypothetical protein
MQLISADITRNGSVDAENINVSWVWRREIRNVTFKMDYKVSSETLFIKLENVESRNIAGFIIVILKFWFSISTDNKQTLNAMNKAAGS